MNCPFCKHVFSTSSVVGKERTPGKTESGQEVKVGVGATITEHLKCIYCGAQVDFVITIISRPDKKGYSENKPTG